MMIESIERRGGVMQLVMEDGSRILLPRAVLREHPLKEGQLFDAESYFRLSEKTMNQKALERAVWWLSKKDISEKQLKRKLAESAFTVESAEKACAFLKEGHYLDDARLSENLVRQKMKTGGPRKIAQLLRQKGVGEETAREALSLISEEETLSSAVTLAAKYLRGKSGEPGELGRKCAAYLARRGFDWDIIKAAVRKANGEEEETDYPE